jgi:hypothetical protein
MGERQHMSGRFAEEKNILSLSVLERRIAQSIAQSALCDQTGCYATVRLSFRVSAFFIF